MSEKLTNQITFLENQNDDRALVPAFFGYGSNIIIIPKNKLKLIAETKAFYILVEI